jgi:hypothetical protein
LVGKTSITYSVAAAVKIAHASISSTLHTAKIAFTLVGQATGAECALVKKKNGKYSKPAY